MMHGECSAHDKSCVRVSYHARYYPAAHRTRIDGNVLRLPTQALISNLGLSALSLVLSQIFRGKVTREPQQGRQSLWSSPPSTRQRKPLIPTVLLPASREELILQYSQPGLQRHMQQASQGFEYPFVCSLLLSWSLWPAHYAF